MTDSARADGHPDLSSLTDEFGPAPASASRASLLRHVASCERCRAELAAREPSALFGVLALEPVPDEILERLDAGLAERLDGGRPRGSRRRLTAMAGVAASFVLAAALGTYVVTRGPATPAPTGGVARTTSVAPPPAALDGVVEPLVISSPGEARVLDLTVGEVDVVMIFDEALRL